MEVHYYAQINDDNICDGVSQLSGIVDKPNMIELERYDMSVWGKMWTGSEWVDNPNPPVIEPQPEPVTNEEIKAKMDQLEQQNVAIMMGMVDVFAAVTSADGGAE